MTSAWTKFDAELFSLTKAELIQWRIAVLDRLAYPVLGLPLLKLYSDQLDPVFFQNAQAGFYGHRGNYKAGYKLCAKMANDQSPLLQNQIQSWITAAGFATTYDNYWLAWRYAANAERLLLDLKDNPAMELTFLRMKLTFLMIRNQFAGRLKLTWLQKIIQKEATAAYELLYDQLIHTGLWTERQIVTHMAERLNPPQKKQPLSLPSDLGYHNLGMPSMDIINVKDMVHSNNPEKIVDGLTKINNSIRKAEKFGVVTEVWKQSRLKIIKQPLSAVNRQKYFNKWWLNLQKPEYCWWLKLVYMADYAIVRFKFYLKTKFAN
ncbi:MAG: hypothetical protein JWR09_2539 [Mucilaginibacter sp.]|nr:hypothetical protein [Mucilaginibacter sp.]